MWVVVKNSFKSKRKMIKTVFFGWRLGNWLFERLEELKTRWTRANGHRKRNKPRIVSSIRCSRFVLHVFIFHSLENEHRDMFRRKKVTQGISWIECCNISHSSVRSSWFFGVSVAGNSQRHCSQEPLKYHFLLNKTKRFPSWSICTHRQVKSDGEG